MIKVTFDGQEEPVDINDDEKLIENCRRLAEDDMKQVPLEESRKVLEEVLTLLHVWHVKNGATITIAAVAGFPGIGMIAALDAHNFIGTHLLRKPPMELPEAQKTGDEDEPEAEPAANDQAEGEDS